VHTSVLKTISGVALRSGVRILRPLFALILSTFGHLRKVREEQAVITRRSPPCSSTSKGRNCKERPQLAQRSLTALLQFQGDHRDQTDADAEETHLDDVTEPIGVLDRVLA
jgi:hypothetical protein